MNIPFGSIPNLMKNYKDFRTQAEQQFGNDPNKVIQNLMNKGMVNQQQYNQAHRIANELQGLFK